MTRVRYIVGASLLCSGIAAAQTGRSSGTRCAGGAGWDRTTYGNDGWWR